MFYSLEFDIVMVLGFFVVWGCVLFLVFIDRMKSRGMGVFNGEFS